MTFLRRPGKDAPDAQVAADSDEKGYASVKNPTIEAALKSLYCFADEAAALKQLDVLRERFILSKHQAPNQDHPSVILWIRGYDVTKNEEKDGLVGNYALITYTVTPEGKYTLTATKLESERKFHPQKRRLPGKHPNWAHPLLRQIKKGKRYPTVDEAQADIQAIHEEFPETTIPCSGKAYVMVYERNDEGKPPIQKYVLEVQLAEGGGFVITIRKNDFQRGEGSKPQRAKPELGAKPLDGPVTAGDGSGYFAAQLELKRAKRGKYNPNGVNTHVPLEETPEGSQA